MDWKARDVMRTDVRTVGPDVGLADLERAFLDARVSGFPVVEDGRLIGMVSRSDVVRQLSVEQSVGEVVSDYYRDFGIGSLEPSQPLASVGRHLGRRLEELRVRDVMIPGLIHVAPGASLTDVARTLVSERIHRVPVVEDGRLVGILSSVDFVRLFAEGRVGPA